MKFRGNVPELLRQYAALLPPEGEKHRSDFYEPLAQFCGVTAVTIGRWLRREKPELPLGLPLIKAEFFFEYAGGEVPHRSHAREFYPLGHKLAELLVFGCVTAKEATKDLGYKDDYAILNMAHGKSRCIANREKDLKALIELHEKEVAERKAAAKREIADAIIKLFRGKVAVAEPSAPALAINPQAAREAVEAKNGVPFDKEALKRTLAHQIFAMQHLLSQAVDRFSAKDRSDLRDLTALKDGRTNAIFEVSSDLNQLCGEDARNHLRLRAAGH